jgi:hypothetical protein
MPRLPIYRFAAMRSWALVGAALVLLAASAPRASSQDQPPAPLALAYKFTAGRVVRQQAKMTASMKMTLPAQAGIAGQELPVETAVTVVTSQKVAAIAPSGEASLATTLETLELKATALGVNFVARGANGKLTATLNGEETAPDFLGGSTLLGLDKLLGKPFTLTMAPNGQVTSLEGEAGGGGIGALSGMSMQELFSGGIVLPKEPVAPGGTWESRTKLDLPVATGKTIQRETTTTNKLVSVTARGGHQIATIESKGETLLTGEGAPDKSKFNQKFSAVTQFDVTAGELVTSTMNWDVAMDTAAVPGPAGASPAPIPISGVTLTGKIKVVVGPAPPPEPAKPASPKKARAGRK